MNETGDRLRAIATEAKAAGFRGCADILKRMARDVDGGDRYNVCQEIEGILSLNYHRREPVDAYWQQAQVAVDIERYREPEPAAIVPSRIEWATDAFRR